MFDIYCQKVPQCANTPTQRSFASLVRIQGRAEHVWKGDRAAHSSVWAIAPKIPRKPGRVKGLLRTQKVTDQCHQPSMLSSRFQGLAIGPLLPLTFCITASLLLTVRPARQPLCCLSDICPGLCLSACSGMLFHQMLYWSSNGTCSEKSP